jgi:RNA polymerase sigma factor (sigma-70 family)
MYEQLSLFGASDEPGQVPVVTTATTAHAAPVPAEGTDFASLLDDPRINRLVRAVARRMLPLFDLFPDIDLADLCQEGLVGALKSKRKFDPRRAALSTFVTLIARRRIVDLYRRRSRGARREGVVIDEARRSQAAWGTSKRRGRYPDLPRRLSLPHRKRMPSWRGATGTE